MDEDFRAAPRVDTGTVSLASGLLLFAPIALLGNVVGLLLRYPVVDTAVLFPPYAALTAALLVSPRRHWVWYVLVGVGAHTIVNWPHWSLSWVLFADVANTVRALTAALLLLWVFGGSPRFDSVRALARFVAIAVVFAPAIGATIGAANTVLHATSATYPALWRGWFLSNALTGLTMLPAFVLTARDWTRWRPQRLTRRRAIEAVVVLAATAAVCGVEVVLQSRSPWQLVLTLYAPLPVLIWIALRFGAAGASIALTAVTVAAIYGAGRRIGPFIASTPDQNVLVLQLFVLLTSIPVLCVAAVSSARQATVRLHHALLASVHDHIAILDARGVVLEINDAWWRFGNGPEAVPCQRIGPGDDCVATCRAAAEGGDPIAARTLVGLTSVLARERARFEIEYDDDRRGRPNRYALSVEALERASGGAIVRRADVTAQRHAQMEIEDQRRQLSHLARVASLGQLSGALAHELNQPLASIGSNAEAARLLIQRKVLDIAALDDIMRDIVSENQRAAQVIRRLRALLQRGEMRLQPLNIGELIDEVLELAHAELITRRVTATADVNPELSLVAGDRVQLHQVLLNLILNACEAMKSTREADRRLCVSATSAPNGQLQISIRDRGTGIRPEVIDRLFEPFVTTKAEGLGLGLSISRTIVAAHGGRLWAENNSDEGGGATVHCVLPSVTSSVVVPAAEWGKAGASPSAVLS